MARHILILDFGRESVNAGIFSSKKVEPEAFFTSQIDGDAGMALSSLLRDIRGKGYEDFTMIMAGIPVSQVSMRVVALPFYDKKVKEVLSFELSELLPEKTDDMFIEAMPVGEQRILAVSVGKKTLQYYLDILKKADVDPSWIGSAIFSKHKLLEDISANGTAVALIDRESVVVSKDGKPYLFSELRDALDLKLAIANLFTEGIEVEKIYSIGNASDKSDIVSGKENVLLPLASRNWGQMLNEYPERTGIIALAAYLKEEGLKQTINFRKGEFAYAKDVRAAKRGMVAAAILAAILLCLWGANAYLKHRMFSSKLVQIEKELKAGYLGLFPGEPNVVDSLYQLEAKLKGLKKENQVFADGMPVLEVMKELAKGIDKHVRIRLYKIHMEEGRIIAKGEADSFEAAGGFKDAIAKASYLQEVSLTDIKTKPGGGVTFSFSIIHKGI
ncbi:MAG: hypothetical protein HZB54_06430 [Deltaproteobacteria bacterium]|nr:hypothetical protein [Deltaproteobacteria bacterium]